MMSAFFLLAQYRSIFPRAQRVIVILSLRLLFFRVDSHSASFFNPEDDCRGIN